MSDAPNYVYVASSWRNPMQQMVVETLRAASINCYDFRNPEQAAGFLWSEVKTPDGPPSIAQCEHCRTEIAQRSYLQNARAEGWKGVEPDYDPDDDPVVWRHTKTGYAACGIGNAFAIPKKGSDWEDRDEFLRMIEHPRAIEGYSHDFAAMEKADTFVMVLPCGKSAHLEIGWAIGAGKRTAILLENPVEPELMYRGADYLARNVMDLLGWLGVQD